MSVYPVILCGGSGARLWPASRPDRPKPFLPLIGDQSSFQQTLRRVVGIRGAREPVVVAGRRHAAAIRDQLQALGVEADVLLEPEARDSAPAIAVAAAWITARDPHGLAVIVASDHHVPDEAAFQAAAGRALAVAEQRWIVTLGVRPTTPSTAFGYIKPGPRALAGAIAQVVEAFIEKPNRAKATAYVAEGYLWNSGNFVSAAATLLAELDRHAPEVSGAARAAIEDGHTGADRVFHLGPAFANAPKISIDYALMEKTNRAAVTPVAFAWSDLGAWDSVKAASPADADGNSVTGQAALIDATGCLVRAPSGVRVGLVGVSGLAVIVEPDAVLVTSLAASQGVKRLAEMAEALPTSGSGSADLGALAARLGGWLDASALPLWWALGADHERGGFHESLDQTGHPTGAARRSRVQARQVFVYASAGAAGWPGPWRAAAEHGLRHLLDHYRRADNLLRPLAGPGGEPLDERANLYDQTFALLAMAAVFRMDPGRVELLYTAGALLDRIRVSFAHPHGGFREAAEQPFQSNPLMHLLEAALAWAEAGGGEVWEALARQIAELALTRLIDSGSGVIREYYGADWTPAEGPAGRIVWPGHQFEWAWLLDRWARRAGHVAARAEALRLFAVGQAGVDAARSLVVDAMDEALTITDARARLWPQTERLKAALALAVGLPAEREAVMLAQAADAARGLSRYLETPTAGLWRDRALPEGGFIHEPAPASSLYHITGAVRALVRAARTQAEAMVDQTQPEAASMV